MKKNDKNDSHKDPKLRKTSSVEGRLELEEKAVLALARGKSMSIIVKSR